MSALYAIVVLVSVSIAGPFADGLMPGGVPAWAGWSAVLAPYAVLGVLLRLAAAWCVRRIDRRGDGRAVALAHRLTGWARLAALAWHLVCVFVLGVLGLVRRVTGDLVLVDELIAAAPAFALLVWSYRILYPIDKRIRAASLMRDLDEGRPVYAFPSRRRYVLSIVRNNLSIMALPLVLILGWAELLDRAVLVLDIPPTATAALVVPGVQLVGALTIFALIPPLMVRVWDTVRIPPGELRDGLESLARTHGVRVRDFLIWRTGGMMLNAAVIGLIPRLRYIVLTDALLDHLPEREVEAVAAHEVAHVRHHHMVWLAVSVLASAMLAGWAVSAGSRSAGLGFAVETWGGGVVILAGVLLTLGAVSRRFEWQADAFAARHLSRGGAVVTDEAASAMSDALARVSGLNGIPESKFTWRHGSIASRRRRLESLRGKPIDRLRIDRQVRLIRALAAAGFIVGLVLTAREMRDETPPPGPVAAPAEPLR